MVKSSTFELSLPFQKRLKEKMIVREKIKLSDGNQSFWNKLFAVVLSVSFASFCTGCYFLFGISWMLLFFSLLMAITIVGLCVYSRRKMAEISVKGDVLLVKSINGTHQVTTLSSVKCFKSRSFLNLSLTRLSYYLDGARQEIVSFRILRDKEPLPEHVFQFILNNKRE